MKGPDLAPPLGHSYLAWSNSIRLDLQALGVDKRAEARVLGPLEIAAEIDATKAEERPAEAQTAEEPEPGDEP